jgi:hypothetical protein
MMQFFDDGYALFCRLMRRAPVVSRFLRLYAGRQQ